MTTLSQEYFDEKIVELHARIDKRFGGVEDRLDRVESVLHEHAQKLDAILEAVATRRELQNLVRELKAQGIQLDETRIFAA